MDAVEIVGDGRGMSAAAAVRGGKTVEIPSNGWCLYNALLEVFSPPVPPLTDPDNRTTYARMFAFILGQYMRDGIVNHPDNLNMVTLEHALRGEVIYMDGQPHGTRSQYGYYTEELAEDARGTKTQDCIMKNNRCRVKYDTLDTFFDHLHDTIGSGSQDAKIWGDYVALQYAIQRAFTVIANHMNKRINISVENAEGVEIPGVSISLGPEDAGSAINIFLIHTGRHFNVRFNIDGSEIMSDVDKVNPIKILNEVEDFRTEHFNQIFPRGIALAPEYEFRAASGARAGAAAASSIQPQPVTVVPSPSPLIVSQSGPQQPMGTPPLQMRAPVVVPQVAGTESLDDLLVKAAETLNIGAQLLLDLHTLQPAQIRPSAIDRDSTLAGSAASAVHRMFRTPLAGRPQAPAVPKPRLPPPSVAVRAPTRRRLPLTQPPSRRAIPAIPVSLPSAAATVGVSAEELSQPGWAPPQMETSLREKCAAAPIVTDECTQLELDKDIRAVHGFIERHQLRNTDPRMLDYIKDSTSGKFSPADLEAKYPDHNVYVRNEGGRPVKMKVSNPYRAKSYRYPTDGGVSFADPAGTGLSDVEKPLHKQNVDLLKAIAPESVIADKRFATAILESLWRCSASQDLAGKPACFPARVLGELRLFEKYNDQATRKQMADDVRVFSEWGMVSDIMRQMILGDVPPVRMDAARVRAEAAAAGISGEPVVAAAAAGISGEPVVAAAVPKPSAVPSIRTIRRGLAVRAPAQIGALGPRFQHGILPPRTIGTASMVM